MNFKKLMMQYRLMNGLDSEGSAGGGEPSFDIEAASDSIGAEIFRNEEGEPPEGEAVPAERREPPTGTPTPPPEQKPEDGQPAADEIAKPTAPKSWKQDVATEWEKLPPSVQAEVLRREEDFHKGIEGYKAHATVGQAFVQAAQPFHQLLADQGHNPVHLSQQLLGAHAMLSLGSPEQKYAQVLEIARQYGVELNPVDPADAPYVDPQVLALQKELQAVKSQITQTERGQEAFRRQQETEIRGKLSNEISAFAADPANAYFDEVANDIAVLIDRGLAKDLKDAYQQAIYRNPVTRDKEIQRAAAEKAESVRKEAAAKADSARRATSTNIRTTAKPASATTGLGSIDETLAATLAEIQSREK